MRIRHALNVQLLAAFLEGMLAAKELKKLCGSHDDRHISGYNMPDDFWVGLDNLDEYMGNFEVKLDEYPGDLFTAYVFGYDPSTAIVTAEIEIDDVLVSQPHFSKEGMYRLRFSIHEGWQDVVSCEWHDSR